MQCTVLDFQPRHPEDPMAAVSVLMGRTIPGLPSTSVEIK
jgi:hypothetical protein